MVVRKRSDLELGEAEFGQLLALIDVLDEVQLLRLQCKISSLIGDPPDSDDGRPDRETDPPPGGLGGPYAGKPLDHYEELSDILEPEDDDGGV